MTSDTDLNRINDAMKSNQLIAKKLVKTSIKKGKLELTGQVGR
jgi:hypothetical protein